MTEKKKLKRLKVGVYSLNPTHSPDACSLVNIGKKFEPLEAVKGIKKGEKTFTLGGEKRFVFFG